MKIRLCIAALCTVVLIMTSCTATPTSKVTQTIIPTQTISVSPLPMITNSDHPAPTNQTTSSTKTTPSATITNVTNSKAFPGTVILGRPTADSLTLSLLATIDSEVFIQYGDTPDRYNAQTTVSKLQKDHPFELEVSGLNKDTQYYYRICHRTSGESNYSAGAQAIFHTQRAPGDSFVFTIDADPHFDNNTDPEKVKVTFQNILDEQPDFNIDLGDTFMSEKQAVRTYAQVENIYTEKRSFFSIFGNSVPLYLAMGNHDGELGWLLNGTENNVAVWASKARELYYPNPYPGGFYIGDNIEEPFVGLRENYYAWQWGDALFVVLDPFWYTKSRNASGWDWTLGKVQYNWLKTTLENSQAKYKFVFAHHLVGGFDMTDKGNGRGGTEAAKFYEWGGQNADGTWGFDKNRPGWGQPIHQLFVENNVTIFFHGHDHFFGKQDLDGVVYQECPQPGAINEKNHADEYDYRTGTFLDGSGHVRVTVSGDQVKVDFVRTFLPGKEPANDKNGEIAYSYIIGTNR